MAKHAANHRITIPTEQSRYKEEAMANFNDGIMRDDSIPESGKVLGDIKNNAVKDYKSKGIARASAF